ncbi:hypothetical protein RRF57_004750 [Xylaria bambusicola]|uniref:Aldehyde dehydrogenase domain-containing protein n=1 Tax=Xylaria bambusicola TaxID=326684 RepID=A0AAN7UB66_9PEZI
MGEKGNRRASVRITINVTVAPSTFIHTFLLSLDHIALDHSYLLAIMLSNIYVELTAPNGVRYTQPRGLFINNDTEKEFATVYAAGEADVDMAVRVAHKALKAPSWKLLSTSDRGALMWKLTDLMEQNLTLGTRENDLVEAIGVIRYYAGWADKTFGQTISTTHQKFVYSSRQPIGVAA